MSHGSRDTFAELVERWTNDPGFRERLRADPEGTVREAGLELDAEDLAALHAADWDLADGDLAARINKPRAYR